MTIALILVLISVVTLLFLVRLAKGHAAAISNPADLAGRIQPVDIRAFRNLTNPAEEDYLREKLAPADFRVVQRERLRAALAYISCAAGNAAVLVRVGEAARHSPDPSIAAAGEQLVETAIRLRIFAFQAMVKLRLGLLVPGARVSASGLVENYERVTRLVFQLGRLQHSGTEVAVS